MTSTTDQASGSAAIVHKADIIDDILDVLGGLLGGSGSGSGGTGDGSGGSTTP